MVIIWPEFAENKLDEIFKYYSHHANERAAKKLVISFINEPKKLIKKPYIGQVEKFLLERKEPYRYLPNPVLRLQITAPDYRPYPYLQLSNSVDQLLDPKHRQPVKERPSDCQQDLGVCKKEIPVIWKIFFCSALPVFIPHHLMIVNFFPLLHMYFKKCGGFIFPVTVNGRKPVFVDHFKPSMIFTSQNIKGIAYFPNSNWDLGSSVFSWISVIALSKVSRLWIPNLESVTQKLNLRRKNTFRE